MLMNLLYTGDNNKGRPITQNVKEIIETYPSYNIDIALDMYLENPNKYTKCHYFRLSFTEAYQEMYAYLFSHTYLVAIHLVENENITSNDVFVNKFLNFVGEYYDDKLETELATVEARFHEIYLRNILPIYSKGMHKPRKDFENYVDIVWRARNRHFNKIVGRLFVEALDTYTEENHYKLSPKTNYEVVYEISHSLTFDIIDRIAMDINPIDFLCKFMKKN
jgi:hypothetical protein